MKKNKKIKTDIKLNIVSSLIINNINKINHDNNNNNNC